MFVKRSTMLIGLLTALFLLLSACAPATPGSDQPVSNTDPTLPVATISPDDMVPGSPVTVTEVQVLLMESFPLQASATVRGELPDSCTIVDRIDVQREGNTFRLEVLTLTPAGVRCRGEHVPFEQSVPLDILGLPAGDYEVRAGDQTATFRLDMDNVLVTDEAACSPSADEKVVESVTGGFCLLVPADFNSVTPEGPVDTLIHGPYYSEASPRAHAELIVALQDLPAGMDLRGWVTEITNFPGQTVAVQEIILGGEPAFAVPDMPGGAPHTSVIASLHDGKLVVLTFQGVGQEDHPQVLEDLARLYALVPQSWAWKK